MSVAKSLVEQSEGRHCPLLWRLLVYWSTITASASPIGQPMARSDVPATGIGAEAFADSAHMAQIANKIPTDSALTACPASKVWNPFLMQSNC